MNSVILPVGVDGQWSKWSPAEVNHCECSGKARQDRTCTNPSPSCGGRSCSGSSYQNVDCDECKCRDDDKKKCSQKCDETEEGYKCSCFKGYKLSGESCTGM